MAKEICGERYMRLRIIAEASVTSLAYQWNAGLRFSDRRLSTRPHSIPDQRWIAMQITFLATLCNAS